MKLKLMMVTLIAMFSFNSKAGLMIEPYVGTGQYATTLDLAAFEDDEVSGESYTSIGGRLGYSLLLFSAGLDYEMMSTGDGDINNTAFFVGVDLPVLLRFYGKYVFNSSFDYDEDGVDASFKDGYAVGAGFTGLPFVVINLEVGAYNYEFEIDATDTQFDASVATTMLSISLPLP